MGKGVLLFVVANDECLHLSPSDFCLCLMPLLKGSQPSGCGARPSPLESSRRSFDSGTPPDPHSLSSSAHIWRQMTHGSVTPPECPVQLVCSSIYKAKSRCCPLSVCSHLWAGPSNPGAPGRRRKQCNKATRVCPELIYQAPSTKVSTEEVTCSGVRPGAR